MRVRLKFNTPSESPCTYNVNKKQGDEEQLVGVDGAMVADFQVGVYNVDLPRRYTSYMAFSVVMCLLCWCCNPLVTLFCVCPALLCSCLVRETTVSVLNDVYNTGSLWE